MGLDKVLTAYVESVNSQILATPPENFPKGQFLFYLNTFGYPILAEGVVPSEPALRDKGSQLSVSAHFNRVSSNIVHASHLIPRNLGGNGYQYNLVALPREFNLGGIRDFERLLETEAKTMDRYLQVFVRYGGAQQIPTELMYRVYGIDKEAVGELIREERFFVMH